MRNAANRFLAGSRRLQSTLSLLALTIGIATSSYAADPGVQVQLDIKKAEPRTVESLTEKGILRDYRFAWTSMAQALESNTLDPLEGPFAGDARQLLRSEVLNQQKSNLSRRYSAQNHRLEAVFYSPEGDVMELHDTAEYQLQFLDSGKVLNDEHVVVHYIVLMTPAADRWVIREFQAVPRF